MVTTDTATWPGVDWTWPQMHARLGLDKMEGDHTGLVILVSGPVSNHYVRWFSSADRLREEETCAIPEDHIIRAAYLTGSTTRTFESLQAMDSPFREKIAEQLVRLLMEPDVSQTYSWEEVSSFLDTNEQLAVVRLKDGQGTLLVLPEDEIMMMRQARRLSDDSIEAVKYLEGAPAELLELLFKLHRDAYHNTKELEQLIDTLMR